MSETGHMKEDELHEQGERTRRERQLLDARIAHTLNERASHINFSPLLRAQIIERLPTHQTSTRRSRLAPVLALASVLLLVAGLVAFLALALRPPQTPAVASLIFTNDTSYTLTTPKELAQGGQLVSLDPTAQHIVYGVARQAGVMYTTDLTNPLAHNELAMRDARDVAWAPDGSALVATIYPAGATIPLLALVPHGQYMHLLGPSALAAAWSPRSIQQITYITQADGKATLWSITPDGQTTRALVSFDLPALPQRLIWSPDGRFLAIVTTPGNTPSRSLLDGPGTALYLFDTQTNTLTDAIQAGNATLGAVIWASNGHVLAYATTDPQGHTTIHALDLISRKTLFTQILQRSLEGMSWSPNSQALVYSDGGSLMARILQGATILFKNVPGSATTPFWLDSQHILYLSTTNGVGRLAHLVATHTITQ